MKYLFFAIIAYQSIASADSLSEIIALAKNNKENFCQKGELFLVHSIRSYRGSYCTEPKGAAIARLVCEGEQDEEFKKSHCANNATDIGIKDASSASKYLQTSLKDGTLKPEDLCETIGEILSEQKTPCLKIVDAANQATRSEEEKAKIKSEKDRLERQAKDREAYETQQKRAREQRAAQEAEQKRAKTKIEAENAIKQEIEQLFGTISLEKSIEQNKQALASLKASLAKAKKDDQDARQTRERALKEINDRTDLDESQKETLIKIKGLKNELESLESSLENKIRWKEDELVKSEASLASARTKALAKIQEIEAHEANISLLKQEIRKQLERIVLVDKNYQLRKEFSVLPGYFDRYTILVIADLKSIEVIPQSVTTRDYKYDYEETKRLDKNLSRDFIRELEKSGLKEALAYLKSL